MTKNISYFRSKCIGCSTCSLMAPNIWQMNPNDGKADLSDTILKKDRYLRRLWDDEEIIVKQIIPLCPTKAITIQ